ncbi:MAG: hypothetical protein MJZ01_08095 [Bacteroidales bacterium]|nr:hypothetical protein [Bacteroidales bacterium]
MKNTFFATCSAIWHTLRRFGLPMLVMVALYIFWSFLPGGYHGNINDQLMLLLACMLSIVFIIVISASKHKIAWSLVCFATAVAYVVELFRLQKAVFPNYYLDNIWLILLLSFLFLPYSDQANCHKQVRYTLRAIMGVVIMLALTMGTLLIIDYFSLSPSRIIVWLLFLLFLFIGLCVIPRPDNNVPDEPHYNICYCIFVNGILAPLTVVVFVVGFALSIANVVAVITDTDVAIKTPDIPVGARISMIAALFFGGLTHFFGRPLISQSSGMSFISIVVRLIPWITLGLLLTSVTGMTMFFNKYGNNHSDMTVFLLIAVPGLIFALWTMFDRKRTLYIIAALPLICYSNYLIGIADRNIIRWQIQNIIEIYPPQSMPMKSTYQLKTWMRLLPDDEQRIMANYLIWEYFLLGEDGCKIIDCNEISESECADIYSKVKDYSLDDEKDIYIIGSDEKSDEDTADTDGKVYDSEDADEMDDDSDYDADGE